MVVQVQLYIILSNTQVSFHAAKSYHIVKNILKSFKLYIQKTNLRSIDREICLRIEDKYIFVKTCLHNKKI